MMLPASPSQQNTPSTHNSTPSTPNITTSTSNKSAPNSASASPKPSALELKARAKGKQRAGGSTDSPLQQHTELEDATADDNDDATSPPAEDGEDEEGDEEIEHPPTPPRPTTHDLHLEQYVTRDLLHAAAITSQSYAHLDLIRSLRLEADFYKRFQSDRRVNPSAVFGPGYQGYGNGHTDAPPQILYPSQKKHPKRRSKSIDFTRKQLRTQAGEAEELVPIRLEIDHDKIKLYDSFTWNLFDRVVPVEQFAENLVEDFHLTPSPPLVKKIAESITSQLNEYHPHIFLEDDPLDPSLPYWAYKNDEMRVLIRLNISIGTYNLVDQFEWDINNRDNSPEEFAAGLVKDLGLSGEFMTAIACSIREQTQRYSRYLYYIGHPFDGRPIEDEDLRQTLLPSPLLSVCRPTGSAKEYSPTLWELSYAELEREEKSVSREARKNKRRLNRRGVLTLPDLKEVTKTQRSQIVSTVLLGAVKKAADMRIISREKQAGDDDDDSDSESEAEITQMPVTPVNNAGMTRRQQMRTAAIAAESKLRQVTPNPEVFGDRVVSVRKERDRMWETRPGAAGVGMSSMVVRLRVGRENLARLARQTMVAPPIFTPNPPVTPHHGQHPLAMSQIALNQHQHSLTPSPAPTAPPPIPPWLTLSLLTLRSRYESDIFEATMRPIHIDTATNLAIPASQLESYKGVGVRTEYQPRIRCGDCPGKLYTCGPGLTTDNFEIHLKNRGHREGVEKRLAAGIAGLVG